MSPFLQLILALMVMIIAAKAGGYISNRLGQPSVLGELLAGLILGPTVIDFVHLPFFTDTHLAETLHHLAEMGVLLLMFIAGLELHLSDLARAGKVSAFAGVIGFALPVLIGAGTALLFNYDSISAWFLGLTIAATSVSISAQTLMELKVLRSRVGISLLGAAVVDDILVVLSLSIFVAVVLGTGSNGAWDIIWIVLRMILYLSLSLFIGRYLFPRLASKIDRLPISQGVVSFVFVAMLLLAWSAEVIGSMAAITGSFLAGLIFAQSNLKQRIEEGFSAMTYGIFVPLFFINIGLSANLRQISSQTLIFLLLLIIGAVLSKLLGSGLGAVLGGLTRKEAIQLGTGMISRGEVGLIVASVGLAEGLITNEAFASLVGMVLVTTLLTPILLRWTFAGSTHSEQPVKVN